MRHLFLGFLLAVSTFVSSTAHAEITATFYSRDFGSYFPHAFVTLKGTIEETGEVVDTNYGFTAVHTTPAILTGSVLGVVETKEAKYVKDSDPHFTLKLNDTDYAKLIAMVTEWKNLPGKSYNLGKRNCVHFAMEAVALLGLQVNRKSKFFKKPKSFLLEVMKLNPNLKL
jgi:hypothetical protein